MERIGIWISALFTLAIFSYLYRDNPLFAFAEHTFVAVSAAHYFVAGYENIVEMAWNPMVVKGQIIWLIPLLIGLLFYARFSTKYRWLSRYPVAIYITAMNAAQMRGALQAEFLTQIQATAALSLANPNNVIFVIGCVSALMYFVHMTKFGANPVMRTGSGIGRLFMMVAFGASISTTVMARFSLLIGRLQFLFGEWIPIIK